MRHSELLPRGDGCRADQLRLAIAVAIRQPGLPAAAQLAGQDLACWAWYDRQLSDHEERHLHLALGDAEALLRDLAARPAATCGQLRAFARRRLLQMREAQAVFDNTTDHGRRPWREYGLDDNPESGDARALRDSCRAAALAG